MAVPGTECAIISNQYKYVIPFQSSNFSIGLFRLVLRVSLHGATTKAVKKSIS